MFREGITLEPFMREPQYESGERATIKMLRELSFNGTFARYERDEWVLLYTYDIAEDENPAREIIIPRTFVPGLVPTVQSLYMLFPPTFVSGRIRASMETMRRIIYKDPTLRGTVSPEQVYE